MIETTFTTIVLPLNNRVICNKTLLLQRSYKQANNAGHLESQILVFP